MWYIDDVSKGSVANNKMMFFLSEQAVSMDSNFNTDTTPQVYMDCRYTNVNIVKIPKTDTTLYHLNI